MKKLFIVLLMVLVCTGLISGCNENGNRTSPASAPADKAASGETIPTLDGVISGTWSLYAGYGQDGSLVYTNSEAADYSFTFDAGNSFSGVYRQDGGYIDATFTGTYDVTNSKAAYQNPYDWYYYATIEKNSIADSGESTLLGKLGEQGIHLIFKFRELDGEKLLYEEGQRLYFKR
jgi:hypothetical protein